MTEDQKAKLLAQVKPKKPKGRPRGKGKPFARGNALGHQWKSGQSGNPGGRPKQIEGLRALCRERSEKMINGLADGVEAKRDLTVAQVAAAAAIWDRGGLTTAVATAADQGRPRRVIIVYEPDE